MRYSVIIPACNEHDCIGRTLEQVLATSDASVEIIIVDQSDNELTKQVVNRFSGVRRVRSAWNSRATTMNHGAREAKGDVLVFLHSDCVLPDEWVSHLTHVDRKCNQRWWFVRAHDYRHWLLQMADWWSKKIARWHAYFLWDNTIVVTKELFDSVGWYWDKVLFEDIDLCRRLKKQSPWFIIDAPVIASWRKFVVNGVRKTMSALVIFQVLFMVGISVEKLAKRYGYLKNR